jgi:hypothetical protein
MVTRVIADAIARVGTPEFEEVLTLMSPEAHGADTEAIEREFAPLYRAIADLKSPRVEAMALVLVHVCDPPVLAVVSPLLPCAVYVLTRARPASTTLANQALSTLREILQTLARQAVYKPLPVAPRALAPKIDMYKKTAPLCSMHLLGKLLTYNYEKQVLAYWRTASEAYRKFALPCHQAFRDLERRLVAAEGQESPPAYPSPYVCGLVFRYLLQYLPAVDPCASDRELSRAELEGVRRNLLGRFPKSKSWPATVEAYLHTLGDGLIYGWDPPVGRRTVRLDTLTTARTLPAASLPRVTADRWPTDTGDGQPAGTLIRCIAVDEETLAAGLAMGEAPDEFQTEAIELDGPMAAESGRRGLMKRTSLYFDRRSVNAMYQHGKVQLHEYVQLYVLQPSGRTDRRPLARQVQLILRLMILMGRSLEDWCRLELAPLPEPCPVPSPDPDPEAIGRLYLDPASLALWYWLPADWPGYRRDVALGCDSAVRFTSRWVCLPLPSVLRADLVSYLATRSITTEQSVSKGWVFPDATAPARSIMPTIVQAAVAAAGVSDAPRLLNRLSGSFVSLFCVRHHLSLIDAAYVQGRVDHLAHTKLWYTYVNALRLVERFWDEARAVDAMLRGAAGVPPVTAEQTPDLWVASLLRGLGGYGSRLVPMVARVRHAMAIFQAAFHSLPTDRAARILYHNRFIAVCYIILHLLTAVRPQQDEAFIASLCGDGLRMLQIDKFSPGFFESRAFRRNARVAAQLAALETAYQSALTLEGFSAGMHAKLGAPVLFFLRADDGTPFRVTAEGVDRVLNGWPEGGDAWPYVANVGRHLQATEHADRMVDWDVANAFMGHERAPREMLGLYSAADLAAAEAEIDRQVTAIADAYSIGVIPYLRGGRA